MGMGTKRIECADVRRRGWLSATTPEIWNFHRNMPIFVYYPNIHTSCFNMLNYAKRGQNIFVTLELYTLQSV